MKHFLFSLLLLISPQILAYNCDLSTWNQGLVQIAQTYYKSMKTVTTGNVNQVEITSYGSGIVISDNHILTAQHVVEEGALVAIRVGSLEFPGTVLWKSKENDLAVVLFTEQKGIAPVDISKLGTKLKHDDLTLTIGITDGRPVMSWGNVNTKAAFNTFRGKGKRITEGFVRGGMSGGPMYKCDKKLVLHGITTSVVKHTTANGEIRRYGGYAEPTSKDLQMIKRIIQQNGI